MEVNIAVQSCDLLGEGPVWCVDEQVLYWVDIQKKILQRWNPKSNVRDYWEMPSEIGSFALRKTGGCIVALRTGFAFFDIDNRSIHPLIDPESEKKYTRFNDGKCDRYGRFWAGTMDEETSNKRAGLYRFDADQTCHNIIERVGVSNGLGWSPDNKTFYYTDSADHAIFAYDFNISTGAIAGKRIFTRTPDRFVPDGLTVDSQGYIWSANWDGWRITRYNPDWEIDDEILLPVQRPTSCMFGGPELNQLYITSATIGLDETELQGQPLAGSVFVIETEVPGLPEPKFIG